MKGRRIVLNKEAFMASQKMLEGPLVLEILSFLSYVMEVL
jgi:hypothetical protein